MSAMLGAMTWLGEQSDTLFLGQGVGGPGTKMSASFDGVPPEKRIEIPVAESLQLGISIGLALEGFVPISVFPRVNFLLCAADQLVNHLDKIPLYSDYRPKVILRTAVGGKKPLDAGVQHTGDLSYGLEKMLSTVEVRRVKSDDCTVGSIYKSVYNSKYSVLVVEEP